MKSPSVDCQSTSSTNPNPRHVAHPLRPKLTLNTCDLSSNASRVPSVPSVLQSFRLYLGGDNVLAGLNFIPSGRAPNTYVPLVVTLHGSFFDASYFDPAHGCPLAVRASQLRLPLLCITRPGYGGTTPLAPQLSNGTELEQEGEFLHGTILPILWETFRGIPSEPVGICLVAQGTGAAVAIIAAALYERNRDRTPYELVGLAVSGIGSLPKEIPCGATTSSAMAGTGSWEQLLGGHASQDTREFEWPWLQVNKWREFNSQWERIREGYCADVKVELMLTFAGHDALWHTNYDACRHFREAFRRAWQDLFLPYAPHCIEISDEGDGYSILALGFAVKSARHKMRQTSLRSSESQEISRVQH